VEPCGTPYSMENAVEELPEVGTTENLKDM
jgi:hypothetical protein